ncbi:TonB-dependent receptor domain-containing protein [Candidatus Neomarinimicrobiota bacterium]
MKNNAVKNNFCTLLLALIIPIFIFGQDNGKITGNIFDIKSGKPLYGVNILVKNTFVGTSTDATGGFIIDHIAEGKYALLISMIGYKKRTISNLEIFSGGSMNIKIELEQDVLASPSIIVTATRKEQDVMESPLSVSVIGPRQIADKSTVSLAEVLTYQPGVNTVKGQLNIRGASGYTLGAGSRSLLLIDGIPLLGSAAGNISWTVIPTSEIERVEIVKSGGSAMYGSSAMGGVLNIITRNAPIEPETRIRIKAGAYSQPKYEQWKWRDNPGIFNTLEISHSRQIGKHGMWFRLQRDDTDGYTQLGWNKSYSLTSKVKLNFGSRYSGSVYGNYYTSKNGLPSQWKSATDPFEAPLGDENDKANGYKFNLNGFLNFIYSPKTVMKLKLGYFDVEWQNDGRTNNDYSHETKGFGEYQISKNWTNKLSTVGGITTQYAKIDAEIFGNHHSNSYAAYFLTQGNFINNFTLSVGSRWEGYWVDNDILDQTIAPQIALNWNKDGVIALRTSYGKGFRVPTIAELFSSSQLNIFKVEPNPDLIAETSDAFEIGSSIILGNFGLISMLKFDGAIFSNRYKNLIEPLPDDNGIIHFENITDAKINGAELGINIGVLDNNLILSTAYTWLDPVAIDDSGNVIDTLSYRFRHNLISTISGYWKQFSATLEYRYASRIGSVQLFEEDYITGSDIRVPINLWNVGFGYTLKGWEIRLRIENMFQYYYVELERNMGEERKISINISKSF